MSTGFDLSARTLALLYSTVQRPSFAMVLEPMATHGSPFWAAFAGFSGQICAAVFLALIAAFSPSVFLWRGAAIRLASTIRPDRGMNPAWLMPRSISLNGVSRALALISASR
ncbi:hypothetical protein [Palleronia aestuarii]|uniref:hypothetical protein n=1 Tax=Palleronia aestuarii TaxID=568105 RepID=UPI0011B81749|nr:hypothetical protein [Palleronia aestuarii]